MKSKLSSSVVTVTAHTEIQSQEQSQNSSLRL